MNKEIDKMEMENIYFIVITGTNDRLCLKYENEPLMIDNIDDAMNYAKMFSDSVKNYMAISVNDFMNKFGY